MKPLTIPLIVLALFPEFAVAATITFDGPPTQSPGTHYAIRQYTEGGFTFKPFGPLDSTPPYRLSRNGGGKSFSPENGSAYLQTLSGGSLEFFTTDGSAFRLISVDLAEYSISNIFPDIPTVTFVGLKGDGGTVSTTFTLDGVIDGTGPLVDFQTFNFGPEFTDLVKVSVPTEGYSLDNLVVVPEPSRLALLLVAAGAMAGGARRRLRV